MNRPDILHMHSPPQLKNLDDKYKELYLVWIVTIHFNTNNDKHKKENESLLFFSNADAGK